MNSQNKVKQSKKSKESTELKILQEENARLKKQLGVGLIFLLFICIASPYTKNPKSADITFYLSFPLSDHNAYDTPISSIFDHSMNNPYDMDKMVTAYTGETGSYQKHDHQKLYCGNCYKSPDGQPFIVNGYYTGISNCGDSYLCYDGHPGTDYPTTQDTPVYAAASGIAYIPNSFPGISNAQALNAIEIDHQNGYKTYYIHLNSQLVSDGQPVTRGQLIGYAGDVGTRPRFYHLHFEVQQNGIPIDPYGWEGSGPDPYHRAVNTNLWEPLINLGGRLTLSAVL